MSLERFIFFGCFKRLICGTHLLDREPSIMRLAIYYVPEPGDTLAQAGCTWLGRDAEAGTARPQPAICRLAALTASPRRYGFHGTLKPPMRLADGVTQAELLAAAHDLAAAVAPLEAPRLRVGLLDGFLALLEAEPSPALHALADQVVIRLDRFRAPPGNAELAKRHPEQLDEPGRRLLARYGYPHVLERWQFHMTLSERLDDETAAWLLPQAKAHFAPALAEPRMINSIAVCAEAEPGAALWLIERIRLSGA
jgi:putative phosphonate metabolism protein